MWLDDSRRSAYVKGVPKKKKKQKARPRRRERGSSPDATREALVTAGIELFARDGLDGPSLDAICARAGFTRGAFYVHFADRDDFLVACMDRVGWSFLESIFPARSGPGPGPTPEPTGLLETVLRFVAALGDGSYPLTPPGNVRPHQLLDACARSERVRERYVALVRASLESVEGLVRTGQTGGLVRPDVGPREVATILLSTVVGAQTLLELGLPIDAPRIAATILAALGAASPPGDVTD